MTHISCITPGTYLRLRREAARLSSHDVAAMIQTSPRLPEHDLIYWLDRIEADVVPATFRTIACLRHCFSFDIDVLAALSTLQLPGSSLLVIPPRLCRVCACSERDACNVNPDDEGFGCSWAGPDLCSACAPDPTDPDDGEPVPFGIDPDDRGNGTPTVPANDDLDQRELAA